jgi:hypothetical protein
MSFRGITSFSQNIKRSLFRRDAESSFYAKKDFPLPKIIPVKQDYLEEYKLKYPYNFIKKAQETADIREIFLRMEEKAVVIKEGESVLNNLFNFPGKRNVYLGDKIRWNYDYPEGYEWPEELSWRSSFLDFSEEKDALNPLLMGRLNQLIYLGKAYLAAGDEKFTLFYKFLLDDFKKNNPFPVGINWSDSSEVSIRMINLVYSIPFFIHSSLIDTEFLNSFLEQIVLHAVYIENNLENDERGYGYLTNLTALAASGFVLKESYYGDKILRLSYAKTEGIIRNIITPEGLSTVRSVPYHPHVLELFIILKTTFDKAGIRISEIFKERYSKMFDALASLLRDDDSLPCIGDPFIRRIIPFSAVTNKFPLVIGCAELNKSTYKDFIPYPSADLIFYKGIESVLSFYQINPSKYNRISYGYPESGIFVLRNNDMHITVDAAEVGSGTKNTAGHNDILSFTLFYRGNEVIVDPGGLLTSDPLLVKQYRSALNHSTICIDNEEPVQTEGVGFLREDLTKPKIGEWHSDETEDLLSVQHYAYTRFPDPVVVKRIFRLLKDKNKLIIRDEIFGGSTHLALNSLILHPDITITQEEDSRFSFSGNVRGEITFSSPAEIYCSIQESIYAPCIGESGKTNKISVNFTTQFPVYLITEIEFK